VVAKLASEQGGTMCVSLAPASFSKTIVYGGEVSSLGVHVVGYQNTVRDGGPGFSGLLGAAWRRLRSHRSKATNPGNAMLLHFPAAEAMSAANMLDTQGCPHILEDMAAAVTPRPTGPPGVRSAPAMAMPKVVVFTRGIYDVVLARDAHYIPRALDQVRADKRPPLNDSIFDAYSAWFPGWPVALCCFNNRAAARPEPLLWWYRPRNPDLLFAPSLDAHDGRPPRLDGTVPVDHTVIFGTDRSLYGSRVLYRDFSNSRDRLEYEAGRYLPTRVLGQQMKGRYPNGDFVCEVPSMLVPSLVIRRPPPGELVGLVRS
jgi:hypothetical protein